MTGQDLPGCPIEAVFGGGDEERYPCIYVKGHDGPHSFEGPNPPWDGPRRAAVGQHTGSIEPRAAPGRDNCEVS